MEKTLRLNETLRGFKDGIRGHAKNADAKVQPGQLGTRPSYSELDQKFGGVQPQDSNWEQEQKQKRCHTLELQPYQVLMAGTISLRTQRI